MLGSPIDPRAIPEDVFDQVSQQRLASASKDSLTRHTLDLKRRLAETPDDPHLLHALGTAIWHQGGAREATALWAAASSREPNLAPPPVMTAAHEVFALLARGERAAAEPKLADAERRYARDPHFQLIRAEQAMRGRNLAGAEAAYRSAYELGPQLYVTALNLARFQAYGKGDPFSARPLFARAVELAPDSAESWSEFGLFEYRQGRAEEARALFGRAKAADIRQPGPDRRLGELSLAKGDLAAARSWYRRALDAAPPQEEEIAIRVALGDVLMKLGRSDEARREMVAVLAHRELPPVLFAMGTLDEAAGDLDQAERRYRRVLELLPAHPLAANNAAMLLVRRGGSPAEALALAEQARAALPNNAIVQGTYGCALSAAGRNADAVQALAPVVDVARDDAWANYCLGRSLVAENRAAEGRHRLMRAIEIEPGFPRRAEVERLIGAAR